MVREILRNEPFKVLIFLKSHPEGGYLSEIARSTSTTYVFITKFIHSLEKKGFVELNSKGRKVFAKLTSTGMELAGLFEQVGRLFGDMDKGIHQ
ncbi:Rrf2 family transcriptional regulator [Candidatus Micrarchaeota archaeon]|nr:Rrf2 family transcriptional regulator [Candidatus Micrarchaeota archaeon]